MSSSSLFRHVNHLVAAAGDRLQSPVLLVLRLYWGWSFFQTGLGKLKHLERTTEFFATLSLPLPKVNAALAGTTEAVGGLLLLVGLCSRLAALPLIFTMVVAYATAERDAVAALFSDPEKFTGAAPFLFLLVAVVVFAFGAGRYSVDRVLAARRGRPAPVARESVDVAV